MKFVAMEFTPVVIIGAARSGTNMLRDMLCSLPGFATWPCDEIGPIWRHHNRNWPNDELPAKLARRARSYIRACFVRRWKRSGRPPFIVEKTCANCLRLPFVAAVLPEAKFIQIIRDGIDVVPSAEKRWRGELEVSAPSYFLSKAKFVPVFDMPSIAQEFLQSRLKVSAGTGERLQTWGPRFSGLDTLRSRPLSEICAHQWVACVAKSDTALAEMTNGKWLRLRYENILTAPVAALQNITEFLSAQPVGTDAANAAASVVQINNIKKKCANILDGRTAAILHETRHRHAYIV